MYGGYQMTSSSKSNTDYCWCDWHCYLNRFLDLFRGHIWMLPEPIYCIRCLKTK